MKIDKTLLDTIRESIENTNQCHYVMINKYSWGKFLCFLKNQNMVLRLKRRY